ncbi:hypothetical protein LJB91_02540, partial [Bacteroidales bacterium OttesenSCG-928-L03]|nr:hypothetical protein [Bacteroidales bacterium OttesenSCG-928-L03]
SGLESLCRIVPDDPKAMVEEIKKYLHGAMSPEERSQRSAVLADLYDNNKNALRIKQLFRSQPE